MTRFAYHSACARTQQHPGGMHCAEYSGYFSPQAWAYIGAQIERERMGASVSVDRVYAAVHDSSDQLESVDFDYLIGTPPGIWIVRPDQQAAALHISRRLAGIGVTRTVFLQEFEPLALDVAGRQCLVSC